MGRWRTAVAVTVGVVAVMLSPILLPVALIFHAADAKRMRALAETFPCLKCGRILGADSLRITDEAWAEYLAEVTRNSIGAIRSRLVKYIDAICPHCGAHHKFTPKQRSFVSAHTGSRKPPIAQ